MLSQGHRWQSEDSIQDLGASKHTLFSPWLTPEHRGGRALVCRGENLRVTTQSAPHPQTGPAADHAEPEMYSWKRSRVSVDTQFRAVLFKVHCTANGSHQGRQDSNFQCRAFDRNIAIICSGRPVAGGGEAARVLPRLQGLHDWARRHSHTPERAPQGQGWPRTHRGQGGCLNVRSRTRIRPDVRTVRSIYVKFKHR